MLVAGFGNQEGIDELIIFPRFRPSSDPVLSLVN